MFRPMFETGRVWALAALAVAVASCGNKPGKDAVRDIQAFLGAAALNDRAAFEASIDRPALRQDLRAQVIEIGRAAGVEVEGGPSEFALNRMINPENIRVIDEAGTPLFGAPQPEQVEALLKRIDGKQVCVHDGSAERRCVLTFEKKKEAEGRKAGWRLVRMPANDVTVALAATEDG